MAMATLSLAPCSLRLYPSSTTTTKTFPSTTTLRTARNLLNVTSLRLQTSLGASMIQSRSKLRCEAKSVDKNDAGVEPKVVVSDQAKESSGSEKQGPPFLTIIAGIVVAALVVWGLWSVVSTILGIFFH